MNAMVKVFTFRGKSLEELNKMPFTQLLELYPSRERRSLKRNLDKHLLEKNEKAQKVLAEGKAPKAIRTHNRDMIVLPQMVGVTYAIYSGKEFVNVTIEPEMISHRFGELVMSRKRVLHGKAGIGATKSSKAATTRG